MPRIGYQLSTLWGYWWRDAQAQLPLLALLAAAVIAIYAGLDLAARRVFARRLAPVGDPLPSFFARAACATWVAALRAAPAIAATLALYLGLMFLGLLDYQIQPYAEAITVAVVIAAAVSGLAVAILTPRYPHWRLVNLSDRSAAQLVRLTRGIAIAFAFDLVLREMIRLMFLPLPVSVAQTLINSIVFAALLIGIVRTRFEPAGLVTAEPVSRYRPRWLKLPLLIISIAILTSSALGYVALGSYVTSQVLLTGSCLVAVTLLHIAIKALAAEPEDNTRPMGRMLESQLGLDRDRRRQVSRGLDWSLNLGLVALAIPAILLSLGFSGTDILNHAKALVFGFEIGHFRISLARILVAIGLFASIVFATRLLQRWLQGSVLTPDRMDPGIAHSVHTGIGYAGIALAGLFAVSYAGFDITNLAIVAGALSVGIGFGLQSIVNNFVSGLILLVERPVKVGDWIVVKGQEGYVRRISVRATEIETFDRASLIMPNSELITGSVTNWTHRNAMGRITINVGASYRSDPEQVIKILTDIAANCPLILQHPKPLVIFEDLGASALEFSLRAVVPDINSGTRGAKQPADSDLEGIPRSRHRDPVPAAGRPSSWRRQRHRRARGGFQGAQAREGCRRIGIRGPHRAHSASQSALDGAACGGRRFRSRRHCRPMMPPIRNRQQGYSRRRLHPGHRRWRGRTEPLQLLAPRHLDQAPSGGLLDKTDRYAIE